MFNSFHVPLVNQDYDSIAFRLINRLEEFKIALVDKYALYLREVNVRGLDVPVNLIGVQALFRECLWTYVLQLGDV